MLLICQVKVCQDNNGNVFGHCNSWKSEMNEHNVIRARREGLGLLCYKVLALQKKYYCVILNRTWIVYKCLLQTPGQLLQKTGKKKYN